VRGREGWGAFGGGGRGGGRGANGATSERRRARPVATRPLSAHPSTHIGVWGGGCTFGDGVARGEPVEQAARTALDRRSARLQPRRREGSTPSRGGHT
jgi:hypothetical protein